ncbi:MAG: SGNH/GDSL hydrolase family protein [Rickettsiales bacterium]|jgi:lysophospholipase L1-like esterase
MGQLLTLFNNSAPIFSAPTPASLTLPGTPLAIYSVVKTPGWGGDCCRIQRSSDTTELDIGFVGGKMNVAAALDFAAGSIISVVKWYDQSGNGYDATASINQTTIIDGNAIGGIQPITLCTASGGGNNTFAIPTVAVSTRDFTLCVAYTSGGGLSNFNGIGAIGTQIRLWWEKFTSVIKGDGVTGNVLDFTPRHGQIDSFIRSGNASNSLMQNNGNTYSGTVLAAATATGANIGGFATVPPSITEHFAYVIYGSALSTGDKALVDNAFNEAFGAGEAFTSKTVYQGDSITAGYTIGAYGMGYPRVVGNINGSGSATYNLGIPGNTISAMYTRVADVTSRYDSGYAKNVNVIFAGTNDIDNRATGTIVGYGTTVWTSYLLPYIQAVQAAGFSRVLVGTIIARNWVGSGTDKTEKETERLAYNTLIRDNAVAEGYTVLDFAGLSEMSNYANTTYIVDAVHPTRLGYNVMGTYAAPIISSWT